MRTYLDKNLLENIIRALLSSDSLIDVLNDHGTDYKEFYGSINQYPEFKEKYHQAREMRADIFVEQIPAIADSRDDPQRVRNMIEARKWYASKMRPQTYGERIDVNVNQSVDLRVAIDEARKRVKHVTSESSDIQDAEVIETKAIEHVTSSGLQPDAKLAVETSSEKEEGILISKDDLFD